MLLFLVACALALPLLPLATDIEPTVTITNLSDTHIGLDANFTFSCSVNQPNLHLFLIIDDTFDSDKMKRIKTVPDEHSVVYIFEDTIPTDNGTTFFCLTLKSGAVQSSVLTLQVEYGPYFLQGAPDTSVLFEKATGSNFNLTCTVTRANPPVEKLTIKPEAGPNWKLVKHDDMSVSLEFTKADPINNTRTFTCMATNNLTTSKLTFNSYVGGPPDNLTVDFIIDSNDSYISISLNLTDDSAVPATEVIYYLKGVFKTNKTCKIPSQSLPLQGSSYLCENVVGQSLRSLTAGANYTLCVYGANYVGEVKLKNYKFTIPSKIPTVNITANSSIILGLNENFAFSCSVDQPNFQLTLLIDDMDNSDKFKRINMTAVPRENAFEYIFVDTVPTDNGTTFACSATSNSSLSIIMSNTLTLQVQWPPKLLSPVSVPTQRAGNTRLEIALNISANPGVSFTLWERNGVEIVNISNISPGLDKLTFTSLLPADNGSYSAVVFNALGNITVLFDMMVLYPPIVTVPKQLGGYLDEPLRLIISVDANPTNYTVKWLRNGKEFKPERGVEVNRNVITFDNLTKEDTGNYTMIAKNDIGNATRSFELLAFDGPYFAQGAPDTSVLFEQATGSNFSLTCTVTKANPPVEKLTITPETGPNWKLVKHGDMSVSLEFTEANPTNNSRTFTCMATNNLTTSKLTFNSYVGGPPDKMTVQFIPNKTNNAINVTLKVTDKSSVPATGVLYYVKGVSNKNMTCNIPNASLPLNGSSYLCEKAIVQTFKSLRAGANYTIQVYGTNNVGQIKLPGYTFNVPSPAKKKGKKSNGGAIAAGVIVPLAVIALICVAVVAFCYYKRKRSRRGFTLLANDEGSNINSPGYSTDRVIT